MLVAAIVIALVLFLIVPTLCATDPLKAACKEAWDQITLFVIVILILGAAVLLIVREKGWFNRNSGV